MMYFPCVIFNSGVLSLFFCCLCVVCMLCMCVCVVICVFVCVCVLVRVSDIRISPCTVQGLSVFVLCLLQRQLKPEVRCPFGGGTSAFVSCLQRGRVLEHKQQFLEARICYENAIAINPGHTKSLHHLVGAVVVVTAVVV